MKLDVCHCLVLGLLTLTWETTPFSAAEPVNRCDLAAAQAASLTGVPIDLLLAITRVETGRGGGDPGPWPWTINADGAGAWYPNMAEAVAAATLHQTDLTGTFDVGCFQLNIKWHGGEFESLSDMFDPEKNAVYAAQFLYRLFQESGNWATAVSTYHSRTPELAKAYLAKVKAVLDDPGLTPAMAVAARQTESRENLFPLLQAGEQGSTGSLVPLQAARSPIIANYF